MKNNQLSDFEKKELKKEKKYLKKHFKQLFFSYLESDIACDLKDRRNKVYVYQQILKRLK